MKRVWEGRVLIVSDDSDVHCALCGVAREALTLVILAANSGASMPVHCLKKRSYRCNVCELYTNLT